MLNGTAMQNANMILAERNHQIKQTRQQSQAVELNKREKKELAQQPEIKPRRNSKKREVLALE
jgi:hypothetical protein